MGTSPVLVISSFLAALAIWFMFTGRGVVLAASPGFMAQMLAIPPVHSLFLDLSAVLGIRSGSGAVTLIFAIGLLVVRAALLAFWISLIIERLPTPLPEQADTPSASASPSTLAKVLRRGSRNLGAMVVVEAGFFFLSMATALFLALALGQLALILVLIGALYFLVFVPIIVVVENTTMPEAARLSFRAARFPGPRHMVATFSYLVLALFISVFIPPSRVASATPDLVVWLFVLFMSFVHVAALATFTYRWLLIRDRVLAAGEGGTRRPVRIPSPVR